MSQVHESEFGPNWNFFTTLGFVHLLYAVLQCAVWLVMPPRLAVSGLTRAAAHCGLAVAAAVVQHSLLAHTSPLCAASAAWWCLPGLRSLPGFAALFLLGRAAGQLAATAFPTSVSAAAATTVGAQTPYRLDPAQCRLGPGLVLAVYSGAGVLLRVVYGLGSPASRSLVGFG